MIYSFYYCTVNAKWEFSAWNIYAFDAVDIGVTWSELQ